MNLNVAVILTVLMLYVRGSEEKLSESAFKDLLNNIYIPQRSKLCNRANLASWGYETDLNNPEKEKNQLKTLSALAEFQKQMWKKYFSDLDPNDYKDPSLKRAAKLFKILGDAALDSDKFTELNQVISNMTRIYSTAKVCPYTKQKCDLEKEGLQLEPGIVTIFTNSTDYNELKYYWKEWRDATGAKMRNLYKRYIELSNESAKANNFPDKGELWRYDFESPNFIEDMDRLWKQIEPLYTQLHKYVGRKLKERYGKELDLSDNLIPAHVFGNMWAQTWTGLSDLVKPFPEASKVDGNAALRDSNFTVLKLFTTADEFYQSLGLPPNDMSYDEKKALIRKPTDGREVVCHASAWDLCDGKDFRIKMCTKVDFEDFIVIHHEMGHIQYYIQYKDQPQYFRGGANPGFHEAIGDTIALSVGTPKHLKKIGLVTGYKEDDEADLNTLMDVALEKIAFMPFGLLVDKWRWDVFSGAVGEDEWNSHWWEYRKKYQKITPPVPRSDETDFDPGAKFHVPADSQYISYFVAHVLQFQLYKGLCEAAGEYNMEGKHEPLHRCDFYQSKRAGDKLSAGLSMGSSKHWSEVLEVMTGEKELNAAALLEYFEPLHNFLTEENLKYVEESQS